MLFPLRGGGGDIRQAARGLFSRKIVLSFLMSKMTKDNGVLNLIIGTLKPLELI